MASERLCVRLTADDMAKLRQAAREDRLPLSTMVRFAIAEWLALSSDEPPAAPTSLCTRTCLTVEIRRS